MKNGYEQHFKKMKDKSFVSNVRTGKRGTGGARKARFPLFSLLFVVLGIAGACYGYFNTNKIETWMSALEVSLFETAKAEASGAKDAPKAAANTSATKGVNGSNIADPTKEAGQKDCTEMKGFSQEELSHFNKLNDRKKELDLRDAELNSLEEELHKQKKEIEDRIVRLEQIRSEVANVLKERVEIDQQRVTTLVDFYSNMKPKQAADIFTKLNENLAVEVLSKMKKKNAADILNLIEPGKARLLSEKFTGYQRQ